jgi:integrase
MMLPNREGALARKPAQPAKTLTDRALKAMKPASSGEPRDVRDKVVPGLAVRIMGSGRCSFVLVARFPGSRNPTRRALGAYGELTLEKARQKARDWLELISKGIDPKLEEERQRQSELTRQVNSFEAVAEVFIADKLPGERKGAEVERNIRREFVPRWKKRPITDLTDLDVLAVINAKKKTAPAQARNLLGEISRFFDWAVDQRVYGLVASPCQNLKPKKIIGKKRRRQRILSDEELFALWRSAKRLPYPAGPVYRLLILAALRLNEGADASWPEFNPVVVRAIRRRKDDVAVDWTSLKPEQLTWTIPAERMKGNNEDARPHLVPLTADILRILESLPLFNGDFLFTTTFGKKPVWISDKIKKDIDARILRTLRAQARRRGDDPAKIELPHWVNHDIRRTVRTHLSRLRVTEEAREAVLAHARPGIKGTYDLHDYVDEKREALELWAVRLRSIVEPPPGNVADLQMERLRRPPRPSGDVAPQALGKRQEK